MSVFSFPCDVALPKGGKVFSAAELEARLGSKPADPSMDLQRALGVVPPSQAPPPVNKLFSVFAGPAAQQAATPPPPPAQPKMTTVWELEAAMKDATLREEKVREQQQMQQKMAMQLKQMQQQQQQQKQTEGSNMAAYNKLIGMIEASGSMPHTPKMPVSTLLLLSSL